MKWTAIIESKNYTRGIATVGVIFTNEQDKFSESLDLTGGSLEVLNSKIIARLAILNTSTDFIDKVVVGPYTPTEPIPDVLVP